MVTSLDDFDPHKDNVYHSPERNIYYSPEKFGLETVGEVAFSHAFHKFDLTVVWKDPSTRAYYYADDSGCSCPSPFEYTGRNGLTPISRLQDLIDHSNKRLDDCKGCTSEEEFNDLKGKVAALIQKVRAA